MNEVYNVNLMLTTVLLNQRWVNAQFISKYGLSRAEVELLAYANSRLCFNAYDARKCFKQMNIQQLRQSIKDLICLNALERLNPGARSKPAVYIVTTKGREFIRLYLAGWIEVLNSQTIHEAIDFLHF